MKTLRKIGLIIIGLLIAIGASYFYTYPYTITEKTPFSNIKFENKKVFIDIENTTYEWISAEGESLKNIQDFAQKKYADKWQHRISGDYILLMKDMGHWVFFSTNLHVKDAYGNSIKKSFTLSEENRSLTQINELKGNQIQRNHSTYIPDSLQYITQRVDGYEPKENTQNTIENFLDFNIKLPMNSWIPKKIAIRDLENLEYELKNSYSYADLKGVNYELIIDAIIADLQNGISKRDLGIQLKRLLAFFGDGHSRVSRSWLKIDSLFLPFKIRKIESKYIAIVENEVFNKAYPEIVSIDGFSIDTLQVIAGEMIAKGSPQFYERGSLDYLRCYGFLQNQLHIKNNVPQIQFTNGKDTITKEIELIDKNNLRALYVRKKSHHKILDNNIGYIYLHKMSKKEEYQNWLHKAMNEFKNTKALIIDVRGNGGGNRKPIYTLLPYFLNSPKVINVNAFRIDKHLDPNIDEPIGRLEKRMAYPKKSTHWTAEERKVISDFEKDFTPEWKLDENKFSKWHYSVVSPNKNYYNKPVVVLMDGDNFSASDIFLAGFKGTKNITLIGEKSSGGSGFAQGKFLVNSGIMYSLSCMASFQPNGKLYDGNGITPDIQIGRKVNDIGKDVVLENAIRIIEN